jgi:hypothetical protein
MRKSWITPRNNALPAGTVQDYFDPHARFDAQSSS